MAIVDSNHDQDLAHMSQLWTLISELSEQLSQNRSLAVSLYSHADVVKVCSTQVLPSLTYLWLSLGAIRIMLFTVKQDLFFVGMLIYRTTVDQATLFTLADITWTNLKVRRTPLITRHYP